MGIDVAESHSHWNYFLALESDLETLTRYIQPTGGNMGTFSIETARLLMSAASECDVVLKLLCKAHEADSRAKNINEYRDELSAQYPELPESQVRVPRFGLTFRPWESWADPQGVPIWWRDNNKVKHERSEHFHCASYKNVLNAMGALFMILLRYHKQLEPGIQLEPITRLYRAPIEQVVSRHTLDGRTVFVFER